jgi:DNA polymerase-3 subunit delta
MKYSDIIQELKNKIYKPIYFLYGEEAFFIDKITDFISENVLSESEKAFNQTVLYGKDSKIEDIINSAKRFPMMANHQVIIVKEAQELKNIEKLEYYAVEPLKSTILVINYKYKSLDKRKKVYKELKKNAVLFESKKLYENQIPDWIIKYLKEKKYSIDQIACRILTDYLGTDLSKVSNELDKLIISLPEGTRITSDHIEKNIGISKNYNNFELQNALRDKDVLKANRIIDHFAKNPKEHPFFMIIISLFSYFSKLLNYHFLKDKSQNNAASVLKINPYFVKDYSLSAKRYDIKKLVSIIALLREYEMKAKGYNNVSTSHADLLREMIFKIVH